MPWSLLVVTPHFACEQCDHRVCAAADYASDGAGSGALDSRSSRSERNAIFRGLVITAVLGLGFLVGQWLAWKELQNRGFYMASNAQQFFCVSVDRRCTRFT